MINHYLECRQENVELRQKVLELEEDILAPLEKIYNQDPLTNISLMVPMLNDRAREAVSYFMYGCYIGEALAKDGQAENTDQDKQLQEA